MFSYKTLKEKEFQTTYGYVSWMRQQGMVDDDIVEWFPYANIITPQVLIYNPIKHIIKIMTLDAVEDKGVDAPWTIV